MIHPHTPSCRASILYAAISLAVVTAPSFAAVKTWDGGGSNDNWQTGPNWNADTAPLADDQLVFAGTVRLNAANDFAAGTLFNGFTFPTGAGTFNLSGNSVTLTRGISAGNGTVSGGTIINSSANPQNLSLPIQLSTGKITISSPTGAGGMNLSGAFTRSPNSTVVVSRTGGHINTTGTGLANDASGILGGWAVIGNDWASVNGSGNVVAYTGYTFIDSGAITDGANLNYRYTDETNNLSTAAGTTTINTLSASISAARTLALGGQLRLGTKGAIYRLGTSSGNSIFTVSGGSITADGGGAITLWDATTSAANFAATNNNLRIDSPITDDGGNAVSVNIMGYLDIRGANTYTGGTFINQGRVQTGILGAFGAGPVTVYPGGSAFLNQGGNWTNSFTLSGVGSTEAGTNNPAGPGAIRMGSSSNATGTITLAGDTRITSSSNTVSGLTTGPTISGRITGTGALELVPFANNTAFINLSNVGTPNDWNGPLTLNAINATRTLTVKLGAAEQIPDTSNVTVTGANAATLDLNGFNETFGALNGPTSISPRVTNQAGGTTSTLTIGGNNANGDFGGNLEDKISDPIATINLVKNGSGKQVLRGITNYLGTTTVNAGTLESVGDFFGQGAISVSSGAALAANGVVSGDVTLAGGGRLQATGVNGMPTILEGDLNLDSGAILDISTGALPNPPLSVGGAVTPAGGAGSVTVNLSVTGGTQPPAIGQHQLLFYGPVGTLSNPTAFTLGTLPTRFAATLVNDTVNKALVLNVTDSGDFPVWKGALSNEWSTATLGAPKNWVLNSNGATTTDYLSGDMVLFNDSATTTTPDISVADVTPTSVTFNNTTKDYVLTGTKGIQGTTSLTKDGTGRATIATDNGYTGGTVINTGTLQVGNGGTTGSLGTGDVVNEAVLEFKRSNDFTFANLIAGVAGELRHMGTGTTTLSATNTYNGASVISSGTIRLTNSASLGSTGGGGVTVEAGGAIDLGGGTVVNGIDHTQKQFTISGHGPTGAGALVNTGTVTQLNAYERVALAAEASVGGTNRFDIRTATPTAGNPNTALLTLDGHTLRKRGINQFTCVATDITGTGGSIVVEQGLLALETTTNTRGTGTVICEPGTLLQFYQTGFVLGFDYVGITWPITLREGTSIGSANGTVSVVSSPITLEGNATVVPLNAGAPSPASNYPLTLNGTITENGGSYSLTKSGVNVTTLGGTGSSYTGATLVNEGTLVVNGSITASPVTVATGATLGGTGTLGGTVAGNGAVSPGMAVVGTLSTGATTFSATGSLAAQIDSGTLTSDKLAVTGALNLGGSTLTVTDLGAVTLPAGTKFVIASHTGITGTFANAPDGGNLTVGPNTFTIDYDENVSGQLSITLTAAAGSAYDEWATAKGLNGSNNGKLADPDGDGLENVVEFGLDQHPLQPGDGGKLRAAIADVDAGAPVVNAYTLTVPMRTGADFTGSAPADLLSLPVDGVVYRVEGSTTLAGFPLDITEVTPALSAGMTAPATGWTYRSFRLPGTPGSPNLKAFLRVDVAESP